MASQIPGYVPEYEGCFRSPGEQQTPALQQFATAWLGITGGMAMDSMGDHLLHNC